MITLHFLDGTPLYARADRVESVFETEGVMNKKVRTVVTMFTGEAWSVKEAPVDVLLLMHEDLGLRERALEGIQRDKVKVGGTD